MWTPIMLFFFTYSVGSRLCHLEEPHIGMMFTKHIEVDCHFTRETLEDGKITTPLVRTGSQLAL